MKNIVLCSSCPIPTEGFRMVLEKCGEFRVFACPGAAHLQDLPEISPDIVLIDADPGVSLEILGELRMTAPDAAVVLWVSRISSEFAAQALGLSVKGILDKSSSIEQHLLCIRKTAAGEHYVDTDLYVKLLGHKPIKLTPRESQLTPLLAQGLTNKELAHRIGVTEGTVKVYLSKLYRKTDTGDRFALALYVLKNLGVDHASNSIPKPVAPALHARPLFLPEYLSAESLAA